MLEIVREKPWNIVLGLYKLTVSYHMECFKKLEFSNSDKEIKMSQKRNQAKLLSDTVTFSLSQCGNI